ncbi:DUF7151 family protein [Cystobacter fuscus]
MAAWSRPSRPRGQSGSSEWKKPPGTSCPLGGTVIHTGHDTNQDGHLADEEVEETRYACQQPGQRSRIVPEPEGAHCPHGGTALLTGPDTNGNDVLDPGEVTATEYLCHDADPQALLRIEEEAPASTARRADGASSTDWTAMPTACSMMGKS